MIITCTSHDLYIEVGSRIAAINTFRVCKACVKGQPTSGLIFILTFFFFTVPDIHVELADVNTNNNKNDDEKPSTSRSSSAASSDTTLQVSD